LRTDEQAKNGEVFRDFDTREIVIAVPQPPFNPTVKRRPEGRAVVHLPEQLRLHPAMKELGWTGAIDELNNVARRKNQSMSDPILITTNRTILAGFGRWRLAILDGWTEIDCTEYPLGDDEALDFIIRHHQPQRGWNAFVRIGLALTLESNFQQKAQENMRIGGKYKGSTNLSGADHIEVRREIAKVAGTGTGNVGKVKKILRHAHPSIIAALQNGLIRIHRAWKWCKLSKLQQKAEFARYEEERIQRKILREFSATSTNALLDPTQVFKTLEEIEARRPRSIIIRTSCRKRTVVTLGQDSLKNLELDRHG
jgi:hypothetical protein